MDITIYLKYLFSFLFFFFYKNVENAFHQWMEIGISFFFSSCGLEKVLLFYFKKAFETDHRC